MSRDARMVVKSEAVYLRRPRAIPPHPAGTHADINARKH
jgi:hypothetical protein